MGKNFLIYVIICFGGFFSSCSKKENTIEDSSASTSTTTTTTTTMTTNGLRGCNWADPNGNEGVSRVVTPSGLLSSMTAGAAADVGTRISNAVKTSGGTTIRMPINYWTTSSSSYWSVYQSAINAIVTNNCKVILCYWPPVGHHVSDMDQWNYMWQQVDAVYKKNASVLYEPINEPVDYSGSDLCSLYAYFLNQYSPPAWKCVLDGTGYATEVITVGNDSRLKNQYLAQHAYWWFWGDHGVWSDYYSIMSKAIGQYASRTVITEIGVETMRNVNFWSRWESGISPDIAFINGALKYAKDNQMGSFAWSGVNDIDGYRWFTANDNLQEVNPGVANTFRWSWLLTEAPKWIGPIPNGKFQLQNRASGLMLDNLSSTTDGSNVVQGQSSISPNQQWNVGYAAGYYSFSCVAGNKDLDTGGNTADGSIVQQWYQNASINQQWTLVSIGGGYYKLINRSTGKCLDSGGQTVSGSAVQQSSDNGSTTQQWSFVQQ